MSHGSHRSHRSLLKILCRICKTLCSRFRLMVLNLKSWERPAAMSRVFLSSKNETFVLSNIIGINITKLIGTEFF